MTTELDKAIKAAFGEIVDATLDTGPVPKTPRALGDAQVSLRRRLLAVAALVVVVGSGAAGLARWGGGSGDQLVTDAGPPTSVGAASVDDSGSPENALVPGMTTASSSEATENSASAAARFGAALNDLSWVVDLREHATRGIDRDTFVEWGHFGDGDRRLFVVQGPPELLDAVSAADTLGRYTWPQEPMATTVAIRSADETLIIRSEVIERSVAPRTADELFGLGQRIAQISPMDLSGGITIDSAGPNVSYTHATLERSDPGAVAGAHSVVVRRLDGHLGSASAVVTFEAEGTADEERMEENSSTGAITFEAPIGNGRIRVRGVSLRSDEIRAIALATTIVDGRPVVDLPPSLETFSISAAGPQRPSTIKQARYGCDALGEDRVLGALCYTGFATSPGFEDAVYRGDFEHGPPIDGHPSVVSSVGGGNGTLAWEPRPGVIAYVGYSGNNLGSDEIEALARLANRATFLSSEDWSATGPQVVTQTNRW